MEIRKIKANTAAAKNLNLNAFCSGVFLTVLPVTLFSSKVSFLNVFITIGTNVKIIRNRIIRTTKNIIFCPPYKSKCLFLYFPKANKFCFDKQASYE